MATISVRAGLQHPRFDPYVIESMPFKQSTTVVADTSGVLQGGLDFIARYLHPAARIKVPAIVQMEIVNHAERFLTGWRAPRTRTLDLLIDHLISQGGQRVLIRLELQAETEIERTFLLGDPLRSAFQAESDPELSNLNLSTPIRAYADRLILEAARQHQAQSNLGHKVQLLTSDQGLARMALAEGILPLFFIAVSAGDFFGRPFSGVTLNPFNGRLCTLSLTSLLWEIAASFGSMKLETADGEQALVVVAMGEGLAWSPYQSHADLLWCDHSTLPKMEIPEPAMGAGSRHTPGYAVQTGKGNNAATPKARPSRKKQAPSPQPPRVARQRVGPESVSLQRFNVNHLLHLVDALDNEQSLPEDRIIEVVNARNRDGLDEYRRFLGLAGLTVIGGRTWNAAPATQQLAIALRNEDVQSVRALLLRSPSFSLFAKRLAELGVGRNLEANEFRRVLATYKTLGEITRLCAPIAGEGLFSTPSDPSPEGFATAALERFQELDQGTGLVATGAWLEALIRSDGIHPETSRSRLNDANSLHLLRRSTEGSTTEVRFDNHVIHVLRAVAGKPSVMPVHLYRGDYLIPGKSSTSIKIEGVDA